MKETIDRLILDIARRSEKNIAEISPDHSLRMDLGFDSFDLAELTVRIEDRFGVDIFEERMTVDKVSEIYEIIGA
ncbi:acyl carrier protein [Paenibacillaceae bacterium WGS1546]|uniref:acyl carrier protein n=1 Tax=Cohnella sp. WGS1546 TaxID=3366810 RepID=UPI00372CF6EC